MSRKRSGRVALTTMAALSSSAMLAGCGGESPVPAAKAAKVAEKPADAQEVQVFTNVFECAKVTKKTADECADLRNDAIAIGDKEAPRFAAAVDCEAEFGPGQCVEQKEESSGRTHFSPFLAGFLISKALGNGRATPVFNTKDGGYQSANGVRLGYGGAPGKYYASSRNFEAAKTVPKVKPASKFASRGGFGERSRDGWGVAGSGGKDSGGRAHSMGG